MLGGDMLATFIAGLPNITGQTNVANAWGSTPTLGALYRGETNGTAPGYLDNNSVPLYFDASRSNAIYGRSNTVQPPAFSLIPQIKF